MTIVRNLKGSSEEIIRDVCAAALGHVQEIDAGHMCQRLQRIWPLVPGSGVPNDSFAGIGQGKVDEFEVPEGCIPWPKARVTASDLTNMTP